MIVTNYTTKASELSLLSLVSLTDDEWIDFLNSLSQAVPYNGDTKSSITQADLDWVDTNYCVPLVINDGFVKKYNANTKYISVLVSGKGECYLRFWLAENGIFSSYNKVLEELFPSILADEVLKDFWEWWSNFPNEPQNIAGQLITKQYQEFGIGHLQAWIRKILGGKEPKQAWDKYQFNLRPWMYAYELMLHWMDGQLVDNSNGRIKPKFRRN